MSLHVFANFITPFGTAANNRAETEGNITTLQKLIWMGETHSTVSAEAIRFALRRLLGDREKTNRVWNETAQPKPRNEWADDKFSGWATPDGSTYIDDDLLGFMSAQAAKEDGNEGDSDGSEGKTPKKAKGKGTTTLRRGVLEISRAVSLTPWAGDVVFNSNSPWANLGAKDKDHPGIYQAEVHATRYQYGIALTPERLRDKSRAAKAVEALCNLGTVAGNHGRFLFDFSPESVVLRVTDDPAPRLLYCFDTDDSGQTVNAQALLDRVTLGDIDPKELILGGPVALSPVGRNLRERGAFVGEPAGVLQACAEAVRRINQRLGTRG